MGQLNGKKLFDEPHTFDSVVYSDAPEQCFGAYVASAKHTLVYQGQWQTYDRGKSSTWRELKAVHNMLLSFGHSLRGHKVQCHTDNQNIVRVIFNHWLKTLSICVLKITLCFGLGWSSRIQLGRHDKGKDLRFYVPCCTSRIQTYSFVHKLAVYSPSKR